MPRPAHSAALVTALQNFRYATKRHERHNLTYTFTAQRHTFTKQEKTRSVYGYRLDSRPATCDLRSALLQKTSAIFAISAAKKLEPCHPKPLRLCASAPLR